MIWGCYYICLKVFGLCFVRQKCKKNGVKRWAEKDSDREMCLTRKMPLSDVYVSSPGFDPHGRQPRGVRWALLEPRPGQTGRGSCPPHWADLLCQCPLPDRQGDLWHRHVVHAKQEGAASGEALIRLHFQHLSIRWCGLVDVRFNLNHKSRHIIMAHLWQRHGITN